MDSSTKGTCRSCMRRRAVFRISRRGGGTYNRGGRRYWSSICGECATDLIEARGSDRFDARRLAEIAEMVREAPETYN